MSRLEDLIAEFCPESVDYLPLEQILDYSQPTPYIVKSIEYNDSFRTPVLTAGASFILGYTDEEEGIYTASKDEPVIIFDDFTTSFHWVDFNFKVKSSAMKILKEAKPKKALLRYVLYAMQCIIYQPSDHARQWIQKYSKFLIPVPPLPVQEEIVRILNTFTELEAELEAELKARILQYEHYRVNLLDFSPDIPRPPRLTHLLQTLCPDGVSQKELGDIVNILDSQRKPVTKSDRVNGIYPYYGANGIQDYVDNYIFDGTFLLMGEDGSVINEDNSPVITWAVGKIWVNNHAHVLSQKEGVSLRYLYYYLQIIDVFSIVRGVPPKINQKSLREIPVPVPPLPIQEEIVAILDRFEALVSDLKDGLPAEIAARRKQYEYYRSQLLTFKPNPPHLQTQTPSPL